ncbi:MAG: RdgB/HAM1 family non-canonical purine NTP pyrophosphatase [Alphaproteobacteria bacterium]|nr:RdgB/HAM1 family non-canonical purine NTP pyrophosphatase [Alphaproteobacteria bacterium]
MPTKQIVFASRNAGKIKEIKSLLSAYEIEVLSADDLDLPEVQENGTTFEENAKIKALSAAQESGLPALGDDSGLCIHALNNEPGIYSSRYAEKMGGYPNAFSDILKRLEETADKSAHFSCFLVLAFPNGETKTFEGRVDGKIVKPQKGDNGFGFDPIFMPDGYTQTFALLSEEKKNTISHRANAMNAFIEDIKNLF